MITPPWSAVVNAHDLQAMMVNDGVDNHLAEKTAARITELSRTTPLDVATIQAHVDTFLNAYIDTDLGTPQMGKMMAPMIFTMRNITRVYDAIAAWTGKET